MVVILIVVPVGGAVLAGTKKAALERRWSINGLLKDCKPSSPPRQGARAHTSDDGETGAHAREDDQAAPESQWPTIPKIMS
jgi:hypothetical protein